MSNRINQLIEELREQCIAERRPLAVFVADETGEGTEYELVNSVTHFLPPFSLMSQIVHLCQ